MGNSCQVSWALSYVHINYILMRSSSWTGCSTPCKLLWWKSSMTCLLWMVALICSSNWGGFMAGSCIPRERMPWWPMYHSSLQWGDTKGPPSGIWVVEFNLLPETKFDPCQMAYVVITWETLSGFSLGKYMKHLVDFPSFIPRMLLSTTCHKLWTSHIFHTKYT